MHLYRTASAIILLHADKYYQLTSTWDVVINREGLYDWLLAQSRSLPLMDTAAAQEAIGRQLLPPIGTQEVWAAGVTYLRSRDARMEESEDSGAADCYQRVYEAERPELFFKSLPHRVGGHGQSVNIRKDSTWDVPEPELTLYINSAGAIQGYTIGNDMSSRSIEGENPLYLPQAKMYERSAALGPCLYVPAEPISPDTKIAMKIFRADKLQYEGETSLRQLKRSLPDLAAWLYRETDFPAGAFLMTGTCLVPPNEFTLAKGDAVHISIDGIGEMVNTIALK
ncbi:MAG: fumarylacetoacetate hydrolase family protein [Bacteroidetes bacterium]|nr:fumarylacetoacetate hydrolase family protein [Bacteroidota bacterium]